MDNRWDDRWIEWSRPEPDDLLQRLPEVIRAMEREALLTPHADRAELLPRMIIHMSEAVDRLRQQQT